MKRTSRKHTSPGARRSVRRNPYYGELNEADGMIRAGEASMRSAVTTYDLQSAARLFMHAAMIAHAEPQGGEMVVRAQEGIESAISRARNLGVREAVQSEPQRHAKKGWFR